MDIHWGAFWRGFKDGFSAGPLVRAVYGFILRRRINCIQRKLNVLIAAEHENPAVRFHLDHIVTGAKLDAALADARRKARELERKQ